MFLKIIITLMQLSIIIVLVEYFSDDLFYIFFVLVLDLKI